MWIRVFNIVLRASIFAFLGKYELHRNDNFVGLRQEVLKIKVDLLKMS